MMKLYRMEMYKLCHKKLFLAGAAITAALMAFYFFISVSSERCVAGDKIYLGYEAVKMDREITREFEGEITDEKINGIVEKYGLPSVYVDNMPGWQDANYLNNFVALYFTDGNWKNNTPISRRYTLAETEFGQAHEKLGITPVLSYVKGWTVFCDMLQFGLVLGSILVICGVSVVFADEKQTGMYPLIFTTWEGPRKDMAAKTMAAFSLAFLVFAGIAGFDLALCAAGYGLDGFESISGMVFQGKMEAPTLIDKILFADYLRILLTAGLFSQLCLCAITLCVSAHNATSFGAAVISAVLWCTPVLLRMFFGGIMHLVVDAMPIFMIMANTLWDIYDFYRIEFVISLAVTVCCLAKTVVYYRKVR